MKQIAHSRNRRASVPDWLGIPAVALALVAATLAPGRAQTLPLPPVQIEVVPESKVVTVTWPEVDRVEGRRPSNIQFVSWDHTSSSLVTIGGEYALDCDYRLRISKIPQDPGFNRRLRLLTRIFENTAGTGAPLREDTLRIFAADSAHALRPALAGDLTVAISNNIGPTSGLLGTVPLTLEGVNSTLAVSASYFVTALNSVSSLAESLRVQVTGPVNLQAIPDPIPPTIPNTTLVVTSPSQVFPIMDAMTLSFGEGSASPSDTVTWSAHYAFPANARITVDLEAFEGYHVWRSDLPDLDDFSLLGEIRQCRSKFEFAHVSQDVASALDIELRYDPVLRLFTFIDRDVHDDFPYRYAVSTFDRGFLGNLEGLTFEGPRATSEKLFPARTARDRARAEIYTVPNPFKRSADFQQREPRVIFANLPTECTIRIYTESADHIATLRHGPGEPRSTTPTSREWNLRSQAGALIVPGIYIFHVQGTDRFEEPDPAGGTRGISESIEHIGKMIVVK